jgi:hypothetical protein
MEVELHHFYLGTKWSWMVSPALPPKTDPWYELGRRLGGPQNRFYNDSEEIIPKLL